MRSCVKMLCAWLFFTAFLVSCSDEEIVTYDMASADKRNAAVSAYTPVIAEGCYANDNYVLELICTEHDEHTEYNMILFSKADGKQIFFGTANGEKEKSDSITAIGVGAIPSRLAVSVSDDALLDVAYTYNGTIVAAAGGPYSYISESWEPELAEENVCFCEGKYRNGEFVLTVREGGGSVKFTVTDADNRVLFEGIQNGAEDLSSVSFDNNGTQLEIAVGVSEGKLYMEIAEYGERSDCEFAGIFKITE